MNRVCLIGVLAASLCGCASRQSEPVGFARQPQLKSDRPGRRTKDSDKAPETPRILPETYYAAGRVAEQQGSPEKAIEHYRKAVSFNHQFTAAYARLGLMLSVTGQHEKAVEEFTRAVELKPGSAILRNNLGFELLYLERWAEAERHLRQAAELDPKLAHAHINLGILLGRTGRYEEALVSFRNVLAEPDAHYNLGLMHRAQGRHAEAAECFRYVLSIHPEFTAAHKQLVHVERRASATTTRPVAPIEDVHTARPGGGVILDAPKGVTSSEKGSKELVDLGTLIDQIIPGVQPEPSTTMPTPAAETSAPGTQHTVKETVTITADPVVHVVPVEPAPVNPTVTTTTTTIEATHEPIQPKTSPTATIGTIEILPEPRVEPAVAAVPEVQPSVQADVRYEMPLAAAARAQLEAEKPSTVIADAPAAAGETILGPPSGTDEVMLVLGESESMERTTPGETPVEMPLSPETQKTLTKIDAMDVSLQIIRNEVECRRVTNTIDANAASVEALPVEPSAGAQTAQTPVDSIPDVTPATTIKALDDSEAAATESSVSFIKAVPVDTAPSENAEATRGPADVGPAYYSPPKTTPRRVRPGHRR